jgi:mevalonate kinase/RimJ/RimL family protein N-acetyltransferase
MTNAFTGPPRTFRAPGKLVLIGEYAVLDGAGAVVAAVDHGVSCTWSPGPRAWTTPGDDAFVRAALGGVPENAGHFAFQDWNPVDLGGSKAGFGGSAAATVAAVIAAGRPPADAFEVHRQVQGSGSGVDVFAALNGGVRRFPDGAQVPAPCFAVVWSGESAKTGPRVAQYKAWQERASFVDDSRALVDGFGYAPVGVTREAWRLLRGMARQAGIAYETPAHCDIADAAERFGGGAKPSGAGGGDIAVAVFPDPDRRAAFIRDCEANNRRVIACTVAEPAGLWALNGAHIDLLPFTPDRLRLALGHRAALEAHIEATVPASWPQPDYAAVLPILADRWSRDPGEAKWAWLAVERASGALVGEIGGKVGPNREGELEFGYAILPECRRRGFAKDAVRTFEAWAAQEPGVRALTAESLDSNVASKAVLRGAGLTEVGARMEAGVRVILWRKALDTR